VTLPIEAAQLFSESVAPAAPGSRAANVMVHVGFMLTGIATTVLAPLLPLLAARWGMADAQAGALFAAQFVGSICSTLLSGFTVKRWGFRPTLVTGFVCISVGIAALALVPSAGAFPAVFCNGIGLGFTIPASNLYVAALARHRAASALNLLNFAWGVGAIACPWLAAMFHGSNGATAFLVLVAILSFVVALWLAMMEFPAAHLAPSHERGDGVLRAGQIAPLASLMFLYIGMEAAVAGWIAAYAQRVGTPGSNAWMVMPSFFWAPFLAGRALAPAVLKRVREATLLRRSLLLSAAGLLLLLATPTFARIAVGVAISGLGFAAVYPLLVAQLPRRLGNATGLLGPMFAFGGLGGATLPWVVGVVSSRFGLLQAGLMVPLLAAILMFGIDAIDRGRQPEMRPD
jgi:FHS family glucose/mannose:H+ symporter-like MFS transporter